MFLVLCSICIRDCDVQFMIKLQPGFQVHPLHLLFHSAKISQSGWFFLLLNQELLTPIYITLDNSLAFSVI